VVKHGPISATELQNEIAASLQVDQDFVAVDLDLKGREVSIGWSRNALPGRNVERRLMEWALDNVAVDETVGQQGVGMRTDVFKGIDAAVSKIEKLCRRGSPAILYLS
jgi:hypothetical protein